MSREQRRIDISVLVNKPEHLPLKDGEQMYADDVVQELRDVVQAAVTAWYQDRGKDLVHLEPLI